METVVAEIAGVIKEITCVCLCGIQNICKAL